MFDVCILEHFGAFLWGPLLLGLWRLYRLSWCGQNQTGPHMLILWLQELMMEALLKILCCLCASQGTPLVGRGSEIPSYMYAI